PQQSETGFLPQYLLPSLDLSKKPGFFCPPQQSETGFLPQYLLPSLDLSKKPGFSQQRAQIRNRVFATIFASQFGFIEKTRFLSPLCKNPVSLTSVQAVRRYEIVDLICKLLMATHPTILNRVQR
ncbi:MULTISPECIES: hypothetical protein, partial [unclassified Microcoleus]|uniref:hypothetical protein n=1 Tax=unclassified Microcoleus TaxID=2642155 RepID=UPI002FD0F7E9